MGTNYYFKPKKFGIDKIKMLYEDYTSKLDRLLNDYIKSYNKMCNEMSKETGDLFECDELTDYDNWWNDMHLAEIEYPKLHICKISIGWRPLFESTKYYKSMQELKNFYEKNKNRISITDEYGEEQGYEWIDCDFC